MESKNGQRTANTKDYLWEKNTNGTCISLATAIPDASKPDLLRIPANSKTRVLEEEHNHEQLQDEYRTRWLRDAGLNKDLMPSYTHQKTQKNAKDNYSMFANSAQHVTYKLDSMLEDLLTTSQGRDTIITVEDKDPSILWQRRTAIKDGNIIILWQFNETLRISLQCTTSCSTR